MYITCACGEWSVAKFSSSGLTVSAVFESCSKVSARVGETPVRCPCRLLSVPVGCAFPSLSSVAPELARGTSGPQNDLVTRVPVPDPGVRAYDVFVRSQPHWDLGDIPRSRRAVCPLSLSCTLASRVPSGCPGAVQRLAGAWWPVPGRVTAAGSSLAGPRAGSGRGSPARAAPRGRAGSAPTANPPPQPKSNVCFAEHCPGCPAARSP